MDIKTLSILELQNLVLLYVRMVNEVEYTHLHNSIRLMNNVGKMFSSDRQPYTEEAVKEKYFANVLFQQQITILALYGFDIFVESFRELLLQTITYTDRVSAHFELDKLLGFEYSYAQAIRKMDTTRTQVIHTELDKLYELLCKDGRSLLTNMQFSDKNALEVAYIQSVKESKTPDELEALLRVYYIPEFSDLVYWNIYFEVSQKNASKPNRASNTWISLFVGWLHNSCTKDTFAAGLAELRKKSENAIDLILPSDFSFSHVEQLRLNYWQAAETARTEIHNFAHST